VDRALALEQLGHEVPADEAGRAGDEVVQGSSRLRVWRQSNLTRDPPRATLGQVL
jgi:hypothetical protein